MDLLKSLTLALALCLAAPALPAAAQTQPPAVLAQAELMQTVQRYADAWASPDAIAAAVTCLSLWTVSSFLR